MRFLIFPLVLAFFTITMFTGCSKPVNVRGDQPPAISEIKIKKVAYKKKAAIGLKSLLSTPIGRQAETLLLETMILTLRKEAPQLVLLKPEDAQFPDFMKSADPFADPDKIFTVTERARMVGYNYLMQTTIVNIRPYEKKTGIWWFRKNRRFVTMVAAVDVYDTATAAKLFSKVIEKTVDLEDIEYEAFISEYQTGILPVDEGIADIAEELGDDAAKAISEATWMASITAVNGLQLTLSTGKGAGLAKGDLLGVIDLSRVLEGARGLRYRVPGYKIADVRLLSVEDASATASLTTAAEVKVGDIVVQAR